jgi:hypothetical protein
MRNLSYSARAVTDSLRSRQSPRETMIRHSFLFLLAALAAACAAEQDLGSRGASGSALSRGEACTCSYTEGCCAEGLSCDECEVSAAGATSCSYSGAEKTPDRKCRPARPDGAMCTSQLQCASGVCSKKSDETVFRCGFGASASSSTGLGSDRCRESLDCTDGKICVDSYCKKQRGERCDSSAECASNKCYGTSPLDYACL